MIRFLRIRNLATIEDLEIRFEPGFSILTGETGAGKSIIIGSIRLVCGDKAWPDMVRTGKNESVIEAVLSRPAGGVQSPALPTGGEEELFLQRIVSEEGSAKAYCDGVLVPLKKLRDTTAGLVDIYGQNDHIFLLRLDSHLDYLDQTAGAMPLRMETTRLAVELRRLVRERSEWKTKERERHQRLDYLEYQIKEIEKADLKPGQEELLRAERNIHRNAEKILSLVEKAVALADSEDVSLAALAVRLRSILEDLSSFDPSFAEIHESLGPIAIAAREAAEFLTRYKDKQDVSPERLEEIEERLSLIESFKRKYGGRLEDIQVYLDRIRGERDDLNRIQEKLAESGDTVARLFAEYADRAGKLSRLRRTAGDGLGNRMEKEIAQLGMKKARFHVRVEPRPTALEDAENVRDSGWDEVEFLISPNPGEDLKPLRRIASGGELSRIMLALKAAGQPKDDFPTLIFDEIDAGIGGETADFVAEKLRRLARTHQVICITHLPQIASYADQHFRIEKRVEKDRTYTTVRKLDDAERIAEIARLMTGSRVTEAARESARTMIRLNRKD